MNCGFGTILLLAACHYARGSISVQPTSVDEAETKSIAQQLNLNVSKILFDVNDKFGIKVKENDAHEVLQKAQQIFSRARDDFDESDEPNTKTNNYQVEVNIPKLMRVIENYVGFAIEGVVLDKTNGKTKKHTKEYLRISFNIRKVKTYLGKLTGLDFGESEEDEIVKRNNPNYAEKLYFNVDVSKVISLLKDIPGLIREQPSKIRQKSSLESEEKIKLKETKPNFYSFTSLAKYLIHLLSGRRFFNKELYGLIEEGPGSIKSENVTYPEGYQEQRLLTLIALKKKMAGSNGK